MKMMLSMPGNRPIANAATANSVLKLLILIFSDLHKKVLSVAQSFLNPLHTNIMPVEHLKFGVANSSTVS